MKSLKTIIITVFTVLILQSCVKEKIKVAEIEGYIFSYNPKSSSSENAVDAALSVINRSLEYVAAANKDSIYVGFAQKDKNGKIEIPKIKNTDYMLVFNQQEFDKMTENANIYGQKPNTNIDFSKEFVFVLIHPSKFISGIQFYDSLNAEVEDENTIMIKPSATELPYSQNENPIYNYGENDCQVKLFKIPKGNYKNINIQWETGEIEKIKMKKCFKIIET